MTERGDGTSSRNFGRLKVQRVRDIAKESYRKKIEFEEDDNIETKPTSLPAESYNSNEPDLSDVRKFTQKYVRERSSTAGGASSRFSAASSKRWGNVESADRYGPVQDDVSKKWSNVKGGGDFFSRKSFKELEYTDYVVEALRKLKYQRPSHIQVRLLVLLRVTEVIWVSVPYM